VIGLVTGFAGGISFQELSGSDLLSPSGDNTVDDAGNQNQEDSNTETVDISNINTENQPVKGDKNADVTMVLYEDFECPFCARFETDTMPQVEENYVESGQVKLVWKDFPLQQLHPWAKPAAETMECVYRQDNDAFWAVKQKVFDNQESMDEGNVEDRILSWAAEEGVQRSETRSCIENGDPSSAVEADLQEGRNFETTVSGSSFVTGTPSVVVYSEGDDRGDPIVGAQPYSAVKDVIDSNLNQ